jgi:hypothetical protein
VTRACRSSLTADVVDGGCYGLRRFPGLLAGSCLGW